MNKTDNKNNKNLKSATEIEFNKDFKKAFELMENSSKNVFVTGRAGTGKSTLLTYFRNNTKKRVVVLAPTGVAALNVKGQTIHSFFKFKPDITLANVKKVNRWGGGSLYKKIDTIVIDEISMVRADLLDCVDKFLKVNRGSSESFGGVQMIFIGDLYQLPPVVTGAERDIFKTHYASPYFFDSQAFGGLDIEFVELEKIYRQKDSDFIELLNSVRNNSTTEEHLEKINERFEADFVARDENFTIYLTTTNALAEEINKKKLYELDEEEFTHQGSITGNFEKSSLPTDIDLVVKVGSQVMMLNNDSQGRWVNGTIGKIVGIKRDEDGDNFDTEEGGGDVILVEMSDGEIYEVEPFTWELFRFAYDEEKKSLVSDTVGTFTQYPMKLAWAVTIHKAQGKTFDKVIIDIGRGTFVHGQLYVALSRCTSLEGIVLKQRIAKRHIFMDWRVVKFVTRFQYKRSDEMLPIEEKMRILENIINKRSAVEITYLKANDVKSKRIIQPMRVGEMEYLGRKFLGVEAFDEMRGEERVFRVDRILEINIIKR